MPARGNTIRVTLQKNVSSYTEKLYQFDYGQKLIIEGVELPESYEVHFSNDENGFSKTMIGNTNGVDVPDEMLLNGKNVYVWIFLHNNETDGETEYRCTIPVIKRAKPSDSAPTPIQQDVITQAIATLNNAVERTSQDVTDADAAKDAAEAAQGKAEEAQTAAETAQGKAEEAQAAAEHSAEYAEELNAQVEQNTSDIETLEDTATGLRTDVDAKIPLTMKGSYNGVAELDANGKVPSSQLPSYVDDVVEYPTLSVFPETGESGKIYVATMTNKSYRWSGSTYVELSKSITIGETSSTAYRGDRGKIAYDHAELHGTDYVMGFYKVETNQEGHVVRTTGVSKNDIVDSLGYEPIREHQDISGKVDKTSVGVANGVAELDSTGKVPTEQLPEFSSGVLECDTKDFSERNEWIAGNSYEVGDKVKVTDGNTVNGYICIRNTSAGEMSAEDWEEQTCFPATGENGKVYIADDTNITYRWDGSAYVTIGSDLALGETSSTAYRGDRGAAAYAAAVTNVESAPSSGSGNLITSGAVYTGLSGKADKRDTVLENALSCGRKALTTVADGSFAFGNGVEASGLYSHAEGSASKARNVSAHAEGDNTTASGLSSHSEGGVTTASGQNSHAEGHNTKASAKYSHSEGDSNTASGQASHAEGAYTTAYGMNSHAEGSYSYASGTYSHAEGLNTVASASSSHAEGVDTTASAQASHAEGFRTTANGKSSHASGAYNVSMSAIADWVANTEYAIGDYAKNGSNCYRCKEANSDAEFDSTKWDEVPWSTVQAFVVGNGIDSNNKSNAMTLDWSGDLHLANDVYVGANANGTGGSKLAKQSDLPDISTKADKSGTVLDTTLSRGRKANTTVGTGSFAFGNNVKASGSYSHAEGQDTIASDYASHAEGDSTTASGTVSHAEGGYTTASGLYAHSEGETTIASGNASHAEGVRTIASYSGSHAEGYETTASASHSHAEGRSTTASGNYSHAEGDTTTASGNSAHAEGEYTTANGRATHASGIYNQSMANISNWDANTEYAIGDYAKNGNNYYRCKEANSDAEFDSAKWDQVPWSTIQAFVVGNGSSNNSRSNAMTLDWSGDAHFNGDVYVGANANGTGGNKLAKVSELPDISGKINSTEKGAANGVAELDANGKVPSSQLPSYVDDVIEGYYYDGKFYIEAAHTTEISGETGKVYVDLSTEKTYRWSGSAFVVIGSDLALGETSSTAYRGDRGAAAYAAAVTNVESAPSSESNNLITSGAVFAGLNEKAPKASPVFTGSISLGRKANTTAKTGSSAIGYDVEASGNYSHAEGRYTRATSTQSHAEGYETRAGASCAHAEGSNTTAIGDDSHAEGYYTTASGHYGSHAEGGQTTASGIYSHAEGCGTTANGSASHASGSYNVDMTLISNWVPGTEYVVGDYVNNNYHYYYCTEANSDTTFDSTKWHDFIGNTVQVFVVGNGYDSSNKSNAMTLDRTGDLHLSGDVYANANNNGTGGSKLAKLSDLPEIATISETQAIIDEYEVSA